MCGRYTIIAKADEIASRFRVEVLNYSTPHFNAAPAQLLPIITHDSPQGISYFYWGLAPERAQNKAISERIINTRVESVLDKPVIKKVLMNKRCLVIADGYYEWKKIGKKQFVPYRIVRADRGLFAFAGIWEEYEDLSGTAFHTFSILTTEANSLVQPIHERMPVILTPDGELAWLNPTAKESNLLAVLKPYPSELLDYYTVSPRINSIDLDVPSLILPAPAADQHGNLTLFG